MRLGCSARGYIPGQRWWGTHGATGCCGSTSTRSDSTRPGPGCAPGLKWSLAAPGSPAAAAAAHRRCRRRRRRPRRPRPRRRRRRLRRERRCGRRCRRQRCRCPRAAPARPARAQTARATRRAPSAAMCAARAAVPGQRQGGLHPATVALLPGLHHDGSAMQTPQGYLHALEAKVGRRLPAHGRPGRAPACAQRPSPGWRACWPPARPGAEPAAAGAVAAAADGSAGTPSCRPAFSVASAPTRIFCALSSLRGHRGRGSESAPGRARSLRGAVARRRRPLHACALAVSQSSHAHGLVLHSRPPS